MSTIPDFFKRFAISGLYDHQPEPPNTIAVGDYDTIMAHLPDTTSRHDALQRAEEVMGRVEAAEAEQAITRAGQLAILNDIIDGLARRVDAFVTRRDEQARQDAEQAEREEQLHIQAQLDALPDPDDPNYAPGGLTPSGPTTPEHERRLAAIEDEEQDQHEGEEIIEDNRLTAPADDQGNLPNELVKKAPPELGTEPVFDPAELVNPEMAARKNYVSQPVAVSLNTEDD